MMICPSSQKDTQTSLTKQTTLKKALYLSSSIIGVKLLSSSSFAADSFGSSCASYIILPQKNVPTKAKRRENDVFVVRTRNELCFRKNVHDEEEEEGRRRRRRRRRR
jgi:hypothetical protein